MEADPPAQKETDDEAPVASPSEPSKPYPTRTRVPHVPELPLVTRVLLIALGWLLILVGVAGLVLPGIQGVLTIALGGAVLSLTSRVMLRALRWCFRPWPRGWKRVLSLRARVLARLARGHDDVPGENSGEE